MIIPMKKIQLVFHASHWKEDIEELQNLGILDISYGALDVKSEIGKEYQVISKALHILDEFKTEKKDIEKKNKKYHDIGDTYHRISTIDVANNVLGYFEQKQELLRVNEELQAASNEISKITNKVNIQDIKLLEKFNVSVKLFKINKK